MAGFALNAVLATQMLYYWNAPAKKAAVKPTAGRQPAGKKTHTKKA